MSNELRDTVRIVGKRPQPHPADEMRAEFARLRGERDEAVRRYRMLIRVSEVAAMLALCALFWFAVFA